METLGAHTVKALGAIHGHTDAGKVARHAAAARPSGVVLAHGIRVAELGLGPEAAARRVRVAFLGGGRLGPAPTGADVHVGAVVGHGNTDIVTGARGDPEAARPASFCSDSCDGEGRGGEESCGAHLGVT